jgi:NAD(P)-dependent dehydrogenase (short-subunit alcohol dehydrogenase family)
MSESNFKDPVRRAVVVGAFGGIGAATVDRLARQGWDVVAMDLPQASRAHSAASAVLDVDLATPPRLPRLLLRWP